MNIPLIEILNREGTLEPSSWIHLIALGEVAIALEREDGSTVNLVQVYDAQGIGQIVNRFEDDAKRLSTDGRWAGLLLDWDHFSSDADKPSEAAGWIMELKMRDDGLWGRVEWSDKGRAAVLGKQYKFASVTHSLEDCEVLGCGRVRPTAIRKAALTNEPRNRLLKPYDQEMLNRVQKDLVDADLKKSRSEIVESNSAQTEVTTGESKMDYKSKLIEMLGLAPECTDADIEAAINFAKESTVQLEEACKTKDAAMNSAVEAKNAAETQVAELNNRVGMLTEKLVEADLVIHADVINDVPAVKAQLLSNREGTLAILCGINRTPGKTLENRGEKHDESKPTGLSRTIAAFSKK